MTGPTGIFGRVWTGFAVSWMRAAGVVLRRSRRTSGLRHDDERQARAVGMRHAMSAQTSGSRAIRVSETSFAMGSMSQATPPARRGPISDASLADLPPGAGARRQCPKGRAGHNRRLCRPLHPRGRKTPRSGNRRYARTDPLSQALHRLQRRPTAPSSVPPRRRARPRTGSWPICRSLRRPPMRQDRGGLRHDPPDPQYARAASCQRSDTGRRSHPGREVLQPLRPGHLAGRRAR